MIEGCEKLTAFVEVAATAVDSFVFTRFAALASVAPGDGDLPRLLIAPTSVNER